MLCSVILIGEYIRNQLLHGRMKLVPIASKVIIDNLLQRTRDMLIYFIP